MKRFAIIMAAEQYREAAYSQTPFCHADARLLRDTLVDYCDYAEQDILLELLDPTTDISPTVLLGKLQALGERTEPGDSILFFYAGHGGLFNGDTYLILPTTEVHNKTQTAVPFRDVSNALRLPGRLSLRVFDTCHSGQDVRSSDEGDGLGPADPELDVVGLARALAGSSEEGWITFAACRSDEFSHSDTTIGQGVFTWAFCEAIRSVDAGEEVYPELVKVDLCKRVKDWSTCTRRSQTPAYNSAVSGNVAMAVRRAAPAAVSVEPQPTDQPDVSIADRLARVRAHPLPGTKMHADLLTQTILNVRSSVESGQVRLLQYGCQVAIDGPGRSDSLPEELKRRIVEAVGALGSNALHQIERLQFRDERPATAYERMMGQTGPVYSNSVHYAVTQDRKWPSSVVTLTLTSDGIVPSALLYFYLVPLQIRAALMAGLAMAREDSYSNETWSTKKTGRMIVDLSSTDALTLESFVDRWITALRSQLDAAVTARLDRLEKELRLD